MIEANDPFLKSWIEVSEGSDFPIQNLPFGVARFDGKTRCVSRIGNYVIDLYALAEHGHFDGIGIEDLRVFKNDTLNAYIAEGKSVWRATRECLSRLFREDNGRSAITSKKKRGSCTMFLILKC